MLSNNDSGIVFTDEQQSQLEAWQDRLKAIHTEIKLAEETRDLAKAEAERHVNDRDYQKEQLAIESAELTSLIKEREELQATIRLLKKEESGLDTRIQDAKGNHAVKESELSEREDNLVRAEKASEKKALEIEEGLKSVQAEKNELAGIRAKLQEVLDLIG